VNVGAISSPGPILPRPAPAEAAPTERGGAAASARPSAASGLGDAGATRNGRELTAEEAKRVEELRARDQEVRTHEQAHVAAAGPLLRGGPFFETTSGRDGREYVTSGRVEIDTSEGRTPEETIAKAEQAKRAALAPAEPSSADRSVAAKADQMKAEAQRELREQRAEGADREPRSGPRDGDVTGAGRLIDVFG